MSRRSPKKKLDGLSFDDLRRQIKAGHIEPLYAFLGEESYYHDHALRLLSGPEEGDDALVVLRPGVAGGEDEPVPPALHERTDLHRLGTDIAAE